MKKFIFKIIIIFTIVAIFDYFFGVVMGHVVNNINVGGQGRDNYICNVAEEDILVFGSSRAVHHYNSTILEDSLGMSCYNCGEEANGFILSYGRLLMALERHCPKVIIQDITAEFDLHKNDNHKYLGWLKTRYERAGVSEIFDAIDKTESYKMKSQMYRYNSKFLQNIFVYLTSVSTDMGIKGYRPINEPFDSMKIVKTEKPDDKEIDSLRENKKSKYEEWKFEKISKDDFLKYSNDVENRIKEINNETEKLRINHDRSIKESRLDTSWINHFKRNSKIKKINKKVLKELIECIYVHEKSHINIVFKYKDEFIETINYLKDRGVYDV